MYSERDETNGGGNVNDEPKRKDGGKHDTRRDGERKKNDELEVDEDIISPASYVFRLICDAMNENG